MILRTTEKKVRAVETMKGVTYPKDDRSARGTVVREAMNDVAFPTTKPKATARPMYCPSKTWTTSVSCISESGDIPELSSIQNFSLIYPNRHSPKIIPWTLPCITAKRVIACPMNNTAVATKELFSVPNLATRTPATTGTIVFATRLLPRISDICESLIDNSFLRISLRGPMQSWE
jgi:hypothetical protein